MKVHWQKSVVVSPPVQSVYATLADFPRHVEWSSTLERMECIDPGDESGIGAQYIAHEKVESNPTGLRRFIPHATHARSSSTIRSLVPNRRIEWEAHPIPNVGTALLRFDFEALPDGRTRITQSVDERYPPPVALFLRVVFGISEDSIRRAFDTGILRLEESLNKQQQVRS